MQISRAIQNPKYMSQVTDKTSLTGLMDKLSKINYLTVIFTSNKYVQIGDMRVKNSRLDNEENDITATPVHKAISPK